ncbi:FixH family protein [Pacificispira sp.]|uniref:FixH family protein n=1 Tax=Pacificispira sp. TaxID=2888761 RepID=UPI003BAAA32B
MSADMIDIANVSGAPAKKSRIPLLFFAFFAVVLTANGIMIWIALSSWTGLETKNHYLKGVDYNQTLQDVRTQEALGWTVQSNIAPVVAPDGPPGRFDVVLVLTDRADSAISGAQVEVRLERPTHHGIDVRATLTETAPGRYAAQVDVPVAGQWNLRRLVWSGGGTHQTVERVFLPLEVFE